MYVIGTSENDYLRMVNGKGLTCFNSIGQASIFKNLDQAKLVVGYIQKNIDLIDWDSCTIPRNIIDRKNEFDKNTYIKNLKIYQLVPTEMKP